MPDLLPIAEILQKFPGVTAQHITPLGNAGGFSGARIWRISTSSTTLCLRKWPTGHPSEAELRQIHVLLSHAVNQGLVELPAPIPHRGGDTVLKHRGALYELTPWLPGQADYRVRPNLGRLTSAMRLLARFHTAIGTHTSRPAEPFANRRSPGLVQRKGKLAQLLSGEFDRLAAAVDRYSDAAFRERGQRVLAMFPNCVPHVRRLLDSASAKLVGLQPCIRDVWHDHVLFTDDEVTGLIDFGAMRTDNIACDLARLIGSLVGDDTASWSAALQAYQVHRPLSEDEHLLIRAFDQSGVLMSGLNWLQWICLDGKQFDDLPRVLLRLDENLVRLEQLARMSR